MGEVVTLPTDALDCPNCDGAERWYWRKHDWIRKLADANKMPVESAFAVYAVLSTNATVAENDKNFIAWCTGGEVKHFGTVLERVRLASVGDIGSALAYKKGRKIVAFHSNLRYPWRRFDAPTMDRHAADIVTGDRRESKNWLSRNGGYDELAALYVEGASRVGWRPHEFQARLWVHHVYCNERRVA